jgi:hypothetical protein
VQQVLTNAIWRAVAKTAQTASKRKAAIAYVTKDDIGLRAGDVLITDASRRAIRAGQTDAKLLLKLHEAGVVVHSWEGLHSKVALFGKHAVIGSANMSGSALIEASAITDDPVIVSGIAAFIQKLSTPRTRLGARDIQKLCAIDVVRAGRFVARQQKANPVRRVGNAVWILGVRELKRDPTPAQQERIDRKSRDLAAKHGGDQDDFSWIQWGKKSRFGRECRAGDTIFQIYNWRGDKRRPVVTRRIRVLLKDAEPYFNRFYIQESPGKSNEITWAKFRRVVEQAGFLREVKHMSALRLDSETAKAIDRLWTRTE